ncbi:MAG TPA: hypothetical protein VKE91_11720 [Blastocatellia bacterium]|nr:hypothetical protein [Blastocatellia bacterium]
MTAATATRATQISNRDFDERFCAVAVAFAPGCGVTLVAGA